MAARHVFSLALGITTFCSFLAFNAASALAEEEGVRAVPEVENAKFQFIGKINTNATPVRSGPSNNFYATMKLDKDQEVTVVAIKYDWLKIVPPPGSFSYVPQAYVTRRGDGKIGRVNSTLNVRAGSSVNAMKTTVQLKLDEGQDVEIIEPQDEYFKIVPPEGAYVYIHKQYVTPVAVKQTGEIVRKDGDAEDGQGAAEGIKKPVEEQVEGPSVTQVPEPTGIETPGTQPSEPGATTSPTETAAGKTSALDDFRKLEADFELATKQPTIDQPIEQLTERYTALSKTGALTGMNKRIVDARLTALKMRAQARDQLSEFKKIQEEANARQRDLQIEQREIDERIAQTKVDLFTAVGTLRVSSLQAGNTMLYRLTDPATGRTVVYIRSNDPKYAGLLNQFVGVTGDLTNDERLKMKIITPENAEAVDASKVAAGTVIATITPPSLLGNAGIREPGDAQ